MSGVDASDQDRLKAAEPGVILRLAGNVRLRSLAVML